MSDKRKDVQEGNTCGTESTTNRMANYFHYSLCTIDRVDPITNATSYVYPFLSDNNQQDFHLLSVALEHRPWRTKRGETTAAWSRCANQLTNAKDINGENIFNVEVKQESVRRRVSTMVGLEGYWFNKIGNDRIIREQIRNQKLELVSHENKYVTKDFWYRGDGKYYAHKIKYLVIELLNDIYQVQNPTTEITTATRKYVKRNITNVVSPSESLNVTGTIKKFKVNERNVVEPPPECKSNDTLISDNNNNNNNTDENVVLRQLNHELELLKEEWVKKCTEVNTKRTECKEIKMQYCIAKSQQATVSLQIKFQQDKIKTLMNISDVENNDDGLFDMEDEDDDDV